MTVTRQGQGLIVFGNDECPTARATAAIIVVIIVVTAALSGRPQVIAVPEVGCDSRLIDLYGVPGVRIARGDMADRHLATLIIVVIRQWRWRGRLEMDDYCNAHDDKRAVRADANADDDHRTSAQVAADFDVLAQLECLAVIQHDPVAV